MENILRERLKENYEKELEGIVNHSMKVRDISLKIAEKVKLDDRKDIKLIEIAALLHDIEKPKKNHHKKGSDYIMKKAKKYDEKKDGKFLDCGDDEIKLIALIIRHHKGEVEEYNTKCENKEITEKDLRMIEIVRISDKISKLYKEKNIKNKDKIEKTKTKIQEEINSLIDEGVKEKATNIFKELT